MKVVVAILIISLASCHSRSRIDIQKEYDSINVEKARIEKGIKFVQEEYAYGQSGDVNSNASKNIIESSRRQLDSLNVINQKLEARQKELAGELYK